MKLRSALWTATMLALPFAASAQPVTGLYIGAGAGYNLTLQQNIKNLSFPTVGKIAGGLATSGNLNSGDGAMGLMSIGWGFGNGLRIEAEGNYRYSHAGGFNGTAFGSSGGGTTEQKYGGMGNVLYDFNGVSPWIVPYIGAGIGYLEIGENFHAYNTTTISGIAPGGLAVTGNNTRGSFAYQAILGAAFPVPAVPGLAITAEYRFLGTAGNRSYGGTATAPGAAPVPASVSLGPNYNNSFLVGFRYNFGVAPPPPAPVAAPAPAPARSYLVFFDWDKATLTDRARQIIHEAAANSTKVQYTRIEVNGYTDTSGTPQYNQGLSVRRAQAVAAELVKDGVPRNAISIQGFGETHLLVPTGPGVREPQNRRVEIIIR